MEMTKRVLEIIAEQLGISEDEVTTSLKFRRDLGADSLDFLEVILAMEEEFEIEISDADAAKIDTVQDLLDYLNQNT